MTDPDPAPRSTDWTKRPWFLEGEHRLLDEYGFSRKKREAAARGLRLLYTPDICKSLRDDPENGGLVLPLELSGVPPVAVTAALELGVDLDELPADAVANTPIGKRLLVQRQFRDAAFEVRVWASLIRSGYVVQRVPESAAKAPDYIVSRDGQEVELEVKMLSDAEVDRIADTVNNHVNMLSPIVEGLELFVEGDEQLSTRLFAAAEHEKLLRQQDQIANAVCAVIREIEQAGSRAGDYPVAGVGTVHARSTLQSPSITCDLFQQLNDERKAGRAVRLVRDAAKQASGKRRFACVVGVFQKANLVEIERAIRARIDGDSKSLQPCELVVLVDMLRNNHLDYSVTRRAYPIAVRKHRQLTQAQIRLAQAAAGSCLAKAQVVRASRPGEHGLPAGPSIRRTTRVHLGQVGLEPGKEITFTIPAIGRTAK